MMDWRRFCMNSIPSYSAVVLAAGQGTRTGLAYNKVFYRLPEGCTVLEGALRPFLMDAACRQIVVTAHPGEMEEVQALVQDPRIRVVAGGDTRQDSVRQALEAVTEPVVFIHDGARPYLQNRELEKLKDVMTREKAALLAVPVTDTIKEVHEGRITETPDRRFLYAAQTPQAFDTELIRSCHEAAREQGAAVTDDCMLAEQFGGVQVAVVESDPGNRKITTPADLEQ